MTQKHQEIISNIETYLTKNDLSFDNWNIIKKDQIYISKKLINHMFDKKIFTKSYIPIQKIYNYLTKKITHEFFWMKEIFLQIHIDIFTNYQIASEINECKIKGQHLFTFVIQSLLNNKFAQHDNLIMKVENDFFNDERFGQIIRTNHKGCRVDIILDSIKLVIEYDEPQHESYIHSQSDIERDKLISALGYCTIRYKKKADIFDFLNKLTKLITERIFLFDPSKLLNYIIELFVNDGHPKTRVELLVKEQCEDIINKVERKYVGKTPKNLSIMILITYINADEEFYDELCDMIYEVDIEKYPYQEIENDILLSPKAFDYLLGEISAVDYVFVKELRELYIDIKIEFLTHVYDSNIKMSHMILNNEETIPIIINNSYLRAKKDLFSEHKKTTIKMNNQAETINILENYIKELLPHNGKGLQRKTANDTLSHSEGKSITKQIPELVYRKDKSKHISINAFKTLYKINSWKYHIPTCVTEYIKDIKKKLKCDNNELYNEIITNCELI